MRRRLICIFLVLCLAFGIVACGGGDDGKENNEPITLSAPANLRIIEQSGNVVARWDAVSNAQSYIVTVNGSDNTTTETTYTLGDIYSDYSVVVIACRKGSKNSSPSTTSYSKPSVAVSISGSSECHSGNTLQLTATVTNAPAQNSGVTWTITSGGEHATIDESGKITAKNVSGDKIIVVTATSKYDGTATATKAITISARPDLTQDMLDALDNDRIAYEGFMEVQQWTLNGDYMNAQATLNTRAIMDEGRWYGEYQDLVGLTRFAYFEDREGTAYTSSVDLMNNVNSEPLTDSDNNVVAWSDLDYKNNMKDLTVADFQFNEKTWRWEYKGSGTADENNAKMRAILASAHLFDFVPKTLSLIIDYGEVAGIYAESKDDYSLYAGSIVRMNLTASVNVGSSVYAPVVGKYAHEDMHDDLQEAIDRMRSLTSYTTECLDNSTGIDTGTAYNGYVETITPDACYMRTYDFEPFQASLVEIGSGVHRYSGNDFGYVKVDNDTYNSFKVVDGRYAVEREFKGDFKNAMPSFGFAAEIFTGMKKNSDGSKTYYVDNLMLNVATTLYKGLGNEIAIYGIFANSTYRSRAYVPYITVNADGYITGASFSYFMNSAHGEIKIAYRDFNSATLSADILEKLDELKASPRVSPKAWNDIKITHSQTGSDIEVGEHFKTMFGDADIADKLPYFGAVIGDTYIEGVTDFRSIVVNGTRVSVDSVTLLFDVPFDIDYSIDSSLGKVYSLLTDNGFERTGTNNVYVKDNISVQPVENQMCLIIYVWNNSPTIE